MIHPPETTTFTTLGVTTYTIPGWANVLDIWLKGAGAGGGSGARRATGGIRTGGGGGAGGGASRQTFPVSTFGGKGATISVYIGAGGAGGAAITGNTLNGNNGWASHAVGVGPVWDYIGIDLTQSFNALATHGGTWVAAGNGGVLYSTTTPTVASSWTSRTSNTANQINTIIWAGGSINLFVGVANGGVIITSPDGITWTSQTSGTATNLSDILFDGTTLVACGNSGIILTSTNATAWATNAYSSAAVNNQIVWNGSNLYVIADTLGNIVTASTPTGVWTATATSATPFWGIAYNGSNLYVASASNGVIWTSVNGTVWTSQGQLDTTVNNNQVHYANGYFFHGPAFSSDGLTWYNFIVSDLSSGAQGLLYDSSTGNYYSSYVGVSQPAGAIGILSTIGGNIPTAAFGVVAGSNAGAGGGTSAASGGTPSTAGQFAGGAGGASSSTATAGAGGSGSPSGGGGGGGSADASNTNRAPNTGGRVASMTGMRLLAGAAGVAGGLSPGISPNTTGSLINWGAPGGSGGAFNASTIGQSGANGGVPGGGGGGGAATDNGTNSGAGGDGGRGEIVIIARAA